MPPSVEDRQRSRLARAVADFWAGGLGPPHGDITDVLDLFEVDVEWGTKRDRVSAAIKQVSHQDLVGGVVAWGVEGSESWWRERPGRL